MTQIFRKEFFKTLSSTVAVFWVITLGIGLISSFINVQPARASADGVSSNIQMFDTDLNGKIDRVTVDIANPNFATEQMHVNTGWNICLDVKYDLANITISGTPTIVAGADPAVLTINLDQSDVDLAVNTDAVMTEDKMEVVYTGTTMGGCIDDGSAEDLNDIAVGDTGATDIEIDKAAPYLISATYSDLDGSGKIDTVAFVFSESTFWSDIIEGNWEFSIPGDIGLDGFFTYGNCQGSGTTTVICSDTLNTNVTADANETGGTIQPLFRYVNSVNDIKDSALNNTPAFTKVLSDGAKPVLKTATFYDATGSDGKLDLITTVWTENLDTKDNSAADWALTGDDFSSLVEGEVKCNSGAAGSNECDYNFTTSTVKTNVGNLTLNYVAGTSVTDGVNSAFSKTINAASLPAFTDYAAPILVSSTPTSGYSGYSNTGDFVFTFSEIMDKTGTQMVVNLSPNNAGDLNYYWTSNDTVATVNPTGTLASSTAYILTFTGSISAALSDGNMATKTISFTSASSSSSSSDSDSSSSSSTSTTPVVTLTYPDGGEDLTGGDTKNITWSTSGSGIDTVGIYYSDDEGETYNQIAYNISKSLGSYSWTLPNIDSEIVLVKIIAYDSGKGNLDTDVSTVFEISSDDDVTTEPETPAEEATTTDSEGRLIGTDSGEDGASPVTGNTESISNVVAGQFIRSYYFNTIYYIDENYERRPFWDTNSFFTYADSFDEVVWVTDATLPTMELGDPMLPAAGVVLVKIQSDANVYAIDTGNVLRLVPSETTAASLYGSSWANYVIDLESTTFGRFTVGSDMTTSNVIDLDLMKTRSELAGLAQQVGRTVDGRWQKTQNLGKPAENFLGGFLVASSPPPSLGYGRAWPGTPLLAGRGLVWVYCLTLR